MRSAGKQNSQLIFNTLSFRCEFDNFSAVCRSVAVSLPVVVLVVVVDYVVLIVLL